MNEQFQRQPDTDGSDLHTEGSAFEVGEVTTLIVGYSAGSEWAGKVDKR